MKTYPQNIINLLVEDLIIKDNNYNLIGLIFTLYSGHYTAVLIDIFKNKHILDKNFK